jgi:hypothetical protein
MMYHLCWDPEDRTFLVKQDCMYTWVSNLQATIDDWDYTGTHIDKWLHNLPRLSIAYIGEFTLDYIQSGAVYTDYPEYFI